MPVAKVTSRRIKGTSSSQLHRGVMPEASTKPNTTIRLSPRLKREWSATASGMTNRGKRTLRSRFSRSTSAFTPRAVVSEK
jgi:hypothetical protein